MGPRDNDLVENHATGDSAGLKRELKRIPRGPIRLLRRQTTKKPKLCSELWTLNPLACLSGEPEGL